MSYYKMSEEDLRQWVDHLLSKVTVYGVQAKGDRFAFNALNDSSSLRLDYDVTILPPKKYFLPPKETLLSYKGQKYDSVVDEKPFVLFGVHPYDLAAIRQMDKIFSSDNNDIHYMTRRNNATIVALDVQTPSAHNFSGNMNTAVIEGEYDILLTKVDSSYVVDVRTGKGKELIKGMSGLVTAEMALVDSRHKVWEENKSRLRAYPLKPSLSEIPGLLDKSREHPVWAEKAELCFSCGSCVMVCPTCYCFDVQDEAEWDLSSGKRIRSWDGCMLERFALVAGGHNFRKTKEERYRHRYYRKGKYVAEKVGEISCVGCGRCVSACVPGIANPCEVYNRLKED
ncbi:MAG: 4Fe-4S dicluster domain-containing protein [Spirochaetales bacterium]|nr:4Fe-4S dicluster domain-containing protein [Spirochaetales bacterium]